MEQMVEEYSLKNVIQWLHGSQRDVKDPRLSFIKTYKYTVQVPQSSLKFSFPNGHLLIEGKISFLVPEVSGLSKGQIKISRKTVSFKLECSDYTDLQTTKIYFLTKLPCISYIEGYVCWWLYLTLSNQSTNKTLQSLINKNKERI